KKGYRGYTIVHTYWNDQIKFIRDSMVYADMSGQQIAFIKKAGESIIGSIRDYVDGEWQGDPEDPLGPVLISDETPSSVRFVYVRKEDVVVTPDLEVWSTDEGTLSILG